MRALRCLRFGALLAAGLVASFEAAAQQDRFAYCSQQAQAQSGWYGQQPSSYQQGGAFRGAARGAAFGAMGGAIAGNAGKGAAIGAGVGGLMGGARRAAARSDYDHRMQMYQSILDACMRG